MEGFVKFDEDGNIVFNSDEEREHYTHVIGSAVINFVSSDFVELELFRLESPDGHKLSVVVEIKEWDNPASIDNNQKN